jgi:hypothetical protein
MPSQFTDEEAALMADQRFFLAKAQIMAKVRRLLTATHAALKEDVAAAALVTPPDFNPSNHQFVKGESLELFPYQYLDFPKHFQDSNAFTFRTLFWWGHHVACALILEGADREPVSSACWAGAGTLVGADLVGMETRGRIYAADHP